MLSFLKNYIYYIYLFWVKIKIYHLKGKVQMHSFACGYQVVPVLFVKMNILSPLNDIGTFDKDQLTKNAKVSFWTLNSSPLIYMSSLMSAPHFLIIVVSYYTVKSERFPTLLFFKMIWHFWVSWISTGVLESTCQFLQKLHLGFWKELYWICRSMWQTLQY